MQPDQQLVPIEKPVERESEHDTLLVRNIDTDCDEVTFDTVRVTQRVRDPETGQVFTQFPEITFEFDHSKYFEVRWGGKPFRLAPGETKRMPRFIANHFAIHLTKHMLDKLSVEMKKPMMNNAKEQARIHSQVILGVDQYYEDLGVVDEGTAAYKRFQELNGEDKPPMATDPNYRSPRVKEQSGGAEVNAGLVPKDGLYGTNEEIKSTEEVIKDLGAEQPEDNLNIPEDFKEYTKAKLIQEIRTLDPMYKFKGSENKAQLIGILKRF